MFSVLDKYCAVLLYNASYQCNAALNRFLLVVCCIFFSSYCLYSNRLRVYIVRTFMLLLESRL